MSAAQLASSRSVQPVPVRSIQPVPRPQPIGLPLHTDLPFLFEFDGIPPSVSNGTAGVIIFYFSQPVKITFNEDTLALNKPHILILPMATLHATDSAEDRNSTIVRAQVNASEMREKLQGLGEKGWTVHMHETQWFAHIAMTDEAARIVSTLENTVHNTTPTWHRPHRSQWNYGVGFNPSQVSDRVPNTPLPLDYLDALCGILSPWLPAIKVTNIMIQQFRSRSRVPFSASVPVEGTLTDTHSYVPPKVWLDEPEDSTPLADWAKSCKSTRYFVQGHRAFNVIESSLPPSMSSVLWETMKGFSTHLFTDDFHNLFTPAHTKNYTTNAQALLQTRIITDSQPHTPASLFTAIMTGETPRFVATPPLGKPFQPNQKKPITLYCEKVSRLMDFAASQGATITGAVVVPEEDPTLTSNTTFQLDFRSFVRSLFKYATDVMVFEGVHAWRHSTSTPLQEVISKARPRDTRMLVILVDSSKSYSWGKGNLTSPPTLNRPIVLASSDGGHDLSQSVATALNTTPIHPTPSSFVRLDVNSEYTDLNTIEQVFVTGNRWILEEGANGTGEGSDDVEVKSTMENLPFPRGAITKMANSPFGSSSLRFFIEAKSAEEAQRWSSIMQSKAPLHHKEKPFTAFPFLSHLTRHHFLIKSRGYNSGKADIVEQIDKVLACPALTKCITHVTPATSYCLLVSIDPSKVADTLGMSIPRFLHEAANERELLLTHADTMQIPSRDNPQSDEASEQPLPEGTDKEHPVGELSKEVVVTTPAYIAFKDVKTATGLFGLVDGCARPSHSISSDKIYRVKYSSTESAQIAHGQEVGGCRFSAVTPNLLKRSEVLGKYKGATEWDTVLAAGQGFGSKEAVTTALESLGLPTKGTSILPPPVGSWRNMLALNVLNNFIYGSQSSEDPAPNSVGAIRTEKVKARSNVY